MTKKIGSQEIFNKCWLMGFMKNFVHDEHGDIKEIRQFKIGEISFLLTKKIMSNGVEIRYFYMNDGIVLETHEVRSEEIKRNNAIFISEEIYNKIISTFEKVKISLKRVKILETKLIKEVNEYKHLFEG